MKILYIRYVVVYLLSSYAFVSGATPSEFDYRLGFFDFSQKQPSPCNKEVKCYAPMDLVIETMRSGLEARQQIQVLFQAVKQSHVTMAQILPHINPTNMADSILSFRLADLVPYLNFASIAQSIVDNAQTMTIGTFMPVAGFLFPNRWYDWRASRNVMHAQEEALSSVFANQTLASLQIYFDIERQIRLIKILKYYVKEINALIRFLEEQTVNGQKRAKISDIAVLKNIIGQFQNDRAWIDALSAVRPQLATLIGLSPEIDWSKLKTKPYEFTSLSGESFGTYFDFWPDAEDLSPELNNIRYLIKAAKKNKRSVTFDIFDPDSSDNLDFGYSSRIKIARCNVGILEIRLEATKRQISNAIHNALNTHNVALAAALGVENSFKYLPGIRAVVERNINDTSVPLDITKIARYFQYAEGQAIRLVNAYFAFRSAEAALNRYSWRGPYYEVVSDFIENQVPKTLAKTKKAHSFHRAFLNKLKFDTKKPI